MIRNYRYLCSLVLALGLLLTACGSEVESGPPEINYGRDICIECGMIIDDPRFAAGYRSADGVEKTFDDLGGLILHARDARELEGARVWVSDFENQILIDADTAHYVPTLGVVSPMGHGILAFADRSQAEEVASDLAGEVIGWETVKELPATDGRLGHHHEGPTHGDDGESHAEHG